MRFYQEMITKMKVEKRYSWRYKMVRFANEFGNKPAAKEFGTSPKIVRNWVRRYKEEGLNGLSDRSRRPKTSPNKCPAKFEQAVIRLRKKTGHAFGGRRLAERFDLDFGKSCINRIISEHGLKRKRKTVRQKRNELWSTKKLMRVFEKIQIDAKDLYDIPLYFAASKTTDLPRYEFTARDVKTGATFVCLARRNTSLNAAVFASYLLSHLKNCGFDLTQIQIQTDNGSEFNAGGRKKIGLMPFEFVVKEVFSAQLTNIPPASPTFNSDVETFHRLVEDEFYAIEPVSNADDLLAKAYTYVFEFNFIRLNSYKDNRSPIQIALNDHPDFFKPLLDLQPIILDDHLHLYEVHCDSLTPNPRNPPIPKRDCCKIPSKNS